MIGVSLRTGTVAPTTDATRYFQTGERVGERLVGIDTEASFASSQHSLNHMAVQAAEILVAAGRAVADPGWLLGEANEMLEDLVRPQ